MNGCVSQGVPVHLGLWYREVNKIVSEAQHLNFSLSAFDTSPFRVRREKITEVLGALKSAVWNKFDQKYPPLDPARVVKRALHMENKVPRYNLVTANCEHFATLMRYNKALSDQVGSPVLRSLFFLFFHFNWLSHSHTPPENTISCKALFGAFASIFAYL